MSLACVACRGGVALAAPPVQVEVHLGAGLPMFTIVGLPAAAVKESKERVRAALAQAGYDLPAGRITVNLAPADLPKHGGRFDLAIAVGILIASGQLRAPDIERYELFGELSLDGALRTVAGLLPAARAAAAAGRWLIVPADAAAELSWVPDARIFLANTLAEVGTHLAGSQRLPALADHDLTPRLVAAAAPDLSDVIGQALAKQALLVAAAGGHSLLLVGPPGCGKSMLAQRLPGLLPALTPSEALDVATVASVVTGGARAATAGLMQAGATLQSGQPVQLTRPFRAPHHAASASAVIGGGAHAQPGEITLADHGVLFLDELPEFNRRVLEAPREPLETGMVSVSRASLRAEYPARFQLVAAMNPCPCGYLGDRRRACRCTPPQIAQYRNRISGPLLDRIDLRVAMSSDVAVDVGGTGSAAVSRNTRASAAVGETQPMLLTTASSRERVCAARQRQLQRNDCLNSALSIKQLSQAITLSEAAQKLLAQLREKLALSLRSEHRLLRVARTVADLAGDERVEMTHIAEAQQLRRALE